MDSIKKDITKTKAHKIQDFQDASTLEESSFIQDCNINELLLNDSKDSYKDINEKSKELMIATVSKSKDLILSFINDLRIMIHKEATTNAITQPNFNFLYKNLQMSINSLKYSLQNLDLILKEILCTKQVNISKILSSTQLGLIGSPERLEEIISKIKPLQLDIKNVDGMINIKIKHLSRYTNIDSLFAYKSSNKHYEAMVLKDRSDETLSSYKNIGKRMYKMQKYDISIEYLIKFIRCPNVEKSSKDLFKVLVLLGKSYYIIKEYEKAYENFNMAKKSIDTNSCKYSKKKKAEELIKIASKKLINKQNVSNFVE